MRTMYGVIKASKNGIKSRHLVTDGNKIECIKAVLGCKNCRILNIRYYANVDYYVIYIVPIDGFDAKMRDIIGRRFRC